MTETPAELEIPPAPRHITMRRFANGARIRCKDCTGIRTHHANSLIAFNSSRMAHPVLHSDPDPGTPTATPSEWARSVVR
jgi:hypothetical protein